MRAASLLPKHLATTHVLHRGTLDTNLVVASLGNVPYPSVGVVSRLVIDSQKADMDTTRGEHGHLKVGTNGWSAPWLRPHGGHQIHIGRNVALGLSGETLDPPNNGLLFWFVLGTAKRVLDLGFGRVDT